MRAPRQMSVAVAGVRAKDPELLVRAAVVMPSTFGIGYLFFSNPQVSLFAAFVGCVPGGRASRLTSYGALFAVACGFIALGTRGVDPPGARGRSPWWCSVLVGGLLNICRSPDRHLRHRRSAHLRPGRGRPAPPFRAAWSAGCWPAPSPYRPAYLVWPPPLWQNPRRRLSVAVLAVAREAETHASARPGRPGRRHDLVRSRPAADAVLEHPAACSREGRPGRSRSKLVGRVGWVAGNITPTRTGGTALEPQVAELLDVVAATLRSAAAVICDGDGHPVDDAGTIESLRLWRSLEAMIESSSEPT